MAEKKETPVVSPEEVAELKNLVLEQAERIKSLEKAQAGAAKPAPKPVETPKETFTVGKDKYQFTVPAFIIPERGKVLAADALNDKALLEHLVLIKSGVIKAVK